MTVFEAISKRRSIRKYKSVPVEAEKLEKVLDAGRLAPSARNAQCWHFSVVTDIAVKAKLMDACGGQRFVDEAPAAIVVWADENAPMACGQPHSTVDCSIALSFMMLEAAELGLGTCWLGHFYEDEVKKVLDIPDSAVVVAVTPLGYPGEAPDARPRKALDGIVIRV